VVAVKLPDVPVMVTVAAPVVAELLAVSVRVLVVVVAVGLKDAVTPLGRPEAAKLTLPVKPFWPFTVIVLVPLLPWATDKAVGFADSVKLGGCCAAPEAPPQPARFTTRKHVPARSAPQNNTLADQLIRRFSSILLANPSGAGGQSPPVTHFISSRRVPLTESASIVRPKSSLKTQPQARQARSLNPTSHLYDGGWPRLGCPAQASLGRRFSPEADKSQA